MEVERTTFSEADIREHTFGAGIVPVSVCGKIPYVLLGRERWTPSWKGSCRWSGFEGGRKPNESIAECALREFDEESMHLASPQQAFHSSADKARIVLQVLSDNKTYRYHCTFLVVVPWDADVPRDFDILRAKVQHLERTIQEWNFERPAWFGGYDQEIGDVVQHDDGVVVSKRGGVNTTLPWSASPSDPSVLVANVHNTCVQEHVNTWVRLRDAVEEALIDHPCVHVTRDPRWGFVQQVHINQDYLEKDRIRWWSVDELKEVMRGRGYLDGERFRPYFLPTLQTLIEVLEDASQR